MLNSLGFRPMGSYLNRLGYNVFIPKIGWNIWNVDTQAEKVNEFWKKQNIDSKLPLYVVGHSMGGLISHYWINKFKIKPQKLITLGTPFLGSKSIYWGPWYFFPASKWIKPTTQLPDYIIQKASFEQINVVTDDDALVEIKSGLPERIDSQKIILKQYGGHSALEIREKSFERVGELIEPATSQANS